MAAFTVSIQTIDGVANSVVVSNANAAGGNLTELQTALASYGAAWATPRKLTITGTGTNRLYLINGLKETRNGNWEIEISNGAHVCWAYNNASTNDDVVMGMPVDSAGIYKSVVNISEVMPSDFNDAFTSARGKCVIGLGSYKHYCGSIAYSGPTISGPPFDIWQATTGHGDIYFDNVVIAGARNHFLTRTKIVTTTKTYLPWWAGARVEYGASVLTVYPMSTNREATDNGGVVRLNAAAGSVSRILQPSFNEVGAYSCSTSSRQDVVDPAGTYTKWDAWALEGIVRIKRTVKVTHKDSTLQTAIASSKVVWMTGTMPNTATFSTSQDVELQQSEVSPGTYPTTSGTNGWVDYIQNPYQFYVLAYGYPSITRSVNIKTEHGGTSGVLFNAINTKSTAVNAEITGVVTAPFTFDYNANGTVTLTSNATAQEISNYLYKMAYDDATSAYWRVRGHAPVTLVDGYFDISSICISGVQFLAGPVRGNGDYQAGGPLRSGFIGGPGMVIMQGAPTDLTDVKVLGILAVTEDATWAVTYTDSDITINNNGTGVLTVRNINSRIVVGGVSSRVFVYRPTFINLALNGGRILIADSTGVERYNTTTNQTIELPASAAGTWTYRIARYGQQLITGSFTVDAAVGGTVAIAPAYVTDPQVVDSLAGVQAYSVLDHVQKIYDYASYWRTTTVGLVANPELTLSAGVIATARSIAFQPGGSVLLNSDGSTYTVKASSISGIGITSAGTVTLNGCTHNTPLLINDSTGGTRNITGVAGCYVLIRDIAGNSYTTPRPMSLATTDLNFRTVSGHSYMIHVDAIGRVPYTVNVQSASGTTAIDLAYDRALIPFGSTLTSTVLRVKADRDIATGYSCTEAGVIQFPDGATLSDAYLYARRQDEQRLTKGAPQYNGSDMTTLANASMLGDGVLTGTGNLLVQGQWTGNIGTVKIEDDNGVRIKVVKSELALYNIAARVQTPSGYTELPFLAGVEEAVYAVPRGQSLEIVMWSLGFVTYSRTIQTTDGGGIFTAEMTLNKSIDLALDVSGFIANITLSLDSAGAYPVFVITFNAPMTVSGIELGKAIVHRLVGSETALRSGFPPGSTATIVINADEITTQLPAVRLEVGGTVPVTGRVYLDFFVNTTAARAINPAYSINPPRADGNQVNILRAKPVLDASVLAAGVWAFPERTLTSGGGGGGTTSRPSIEF
jgi:hypothetical protein